MKFIAEPVKYKQRYRWRSIDPITRLEEYQHEVDGEPRGHYWDMLWTCPQAEECGFVLVRVNGGFYITTNLPLDDSPPTIHDHGPYPDLPTCKAFAETYITLNHKPDFSKPFKRRKK